MNPTEDIRARISIEEVVAPFVQLKKNGRNFKGLCPFHQEKTPSFIVSPDKGLAYCFGCRKGGDIFAFLQEVENISFPEALKILAEKAGITLPEQKTAPIKKEEKERVLKLIEEANRFFQKELAKFPNAQEYLENRGYEKTEQKKLGLGYAPDSFHLLNEHLQKLGYKTKEILDAGLAAQKNVGDEHIYDRFRHRVIFPIHDSQGKLVGFGGRTLSSDPEAAKYLNSPETKYYHKGNTLYYFHQAKKSIRELDQAIIVEGYFDALTAHLHGYPQTVASLGTALTEGQITLIGRLTKNLLFAFDADQSGQAAASRSIELAQQLGYNVSIILIPSGKDPDEALRKTPEEWQKAVQGAIKAMDYEFQKALKNHSHKDLDSKKAILNELLPIIKRIPSDTEQEHYLKQLSLELETSLQSLLADFRRLQRPIQIKAKPPEAPQEPFRAHHRSDYLFGLMLNFPQYQPLIREHLKLLYLESEEQKNLYKYVSAHYNQPAVSSDTLAEEEQENRTPTLEKPSEDEEISWKKHLQLLALYTDEKYASFSDEQISAEILSLCTALRSDYRKRRLQEISIQLAKREKTDSLALADELIREHHLLMTDTF